MWRILGIKARIYRFVKEYAMFMKNNTIESYKERILWYYLIVIIGGKKAASYAAFFVFTLC
jgi:hypothetical protein